MRRTFLTWTVAVCLSGTPALSHAADVVACDLFDEPSISALVGVKFKQLMNRHKEAIDGGTISDCVFRADRHSVRVTLWEYVSAKDAAKFYASGLEDAKRPKTIGGVRSQYAIDSSYGIGDKSYWYQLASEQTGATILKANRVLVLNFQFADGDGMARSNTASHLKDRSRPLLVAALRKL